LFEIQGSESRINLAESFKEGCAYANDDFDDIVG
jgi:hypothetical protein